MFRIFFLSLFLWSGFCDAKMAPAGGASHHRHSRLSAKKALPQGLLCYRVTDPVTGAQGTMLGSCHVVSLNAALSQLPADARASIKSSKYVVLESTNTDAEKSEFARLFEEGKTEFRQDYWQQNPKQAEAFLRLLNWAQIPNPEQYLHYSAQGLQNKVFLGGHHFYDTMRSLLPRNQAGAMDSEIGRRCKEQGGVVHALDDVESLRDGLPGNMSADFANRSVYETIVFSKLLKDLYPPSKTRKRAPRKISKDSPYGVFATLKMLWGVWGDSRSIAKQIQPQCKQAHAILKDLKGGSDLVKPHMLARRLALKHPTQWLVDGYFAGQKLAFLKDQDRLVDRDHHWRKKIVGHIQTNKSPFFMFGVGHLENVISQCQTEGYRIEYMTHDGAWIHYPTINGSGDVQRVL